MTRAAVVIGASGGIGAALEDALVEEGEFAKVWGLARSRSGEAHIDITDEASIEAAAARVAKGPPLHRVIVATGLLHDGERGPEKAMKDLDGDWLARNFAVNAIGPALVAKHFVPLLAQGSAAVFAALSARVGSISDNRLGGWHGYRASKAALNMLVKGVAIEATRTNKRSIVVALHPGTVDTPLSKPFQGNVAPGKLFDPGRAALQLLDVIDGLKPVDTCKVIAWDGEEIAP
ncbi:SDR family NAD(P)-dependent oxidoreductase [Stakelama sp. CBK3Z-3]|uniref:SDR family NAD(P)-dependent oxidoreductase n=1 Tax=Stakelama flava TaxID=2860338 RepID=A0ABS6XM34_9SPHN|nr:SDR family NAD(P)-dependent oxidoreductase [Stakelama flava]MBW4330853.1 SDR family NAD(P)-dependent oxidoreductase [Stakelama flava]